MKRIIFAAAVAAMSAFPVHAMERKCSPPGLICVAGEFFDVCYPQTPTCWWEYSPGDLDFLTGGRDRYRGPIDFGTWDGGGGRPRTGDCDEGTPGGASAPVVATEIGNPIDISSGMKREIETDFVAEGAVPLPFVRTYSSYSFGDGLFGRFWQSNWDYRLSPANQSDLVVWVPGRGEFHFTPHPTQANTWVSAISTIPGTISRDASSIYTLVWPGDSILRFNLSGKTLSVKDVAGLGYDFTYNAAGRLDRVTATGGRFIQFNWTGSQLSSVVDPATNVFSYTYQANKFGTDIHLLATVKYPGQTLTSVTYHYEALAWSGALTGKTFGSQRYSWFSYDGKGRATTTEHRIGSTSIEKHSFVYTRPQTGVLQVMTTNPLGKQASYRFNSAGLESVTGLAAPSCPASLYTRTVDSNGLTDIVTDHNNRQTDLDFDGEGRLKKQVRGYGTTQALTSTFDWDVANRITRAAVPGNRSDEFEYDANGRVTKWTSTNLSPRGMANQQLITTMTVNSIHPNGLNASTTVDGPLPGTGDSETRTYNSFGDLLTVSTPIGTFATYSNYNGLGLPGQMIDENGVVATYQYDNRGRILSASQTINGQVVVSSQSYDLQGRITTSTPAGEASVINTYDSAGRMTLTTQEEVIENPDPETTSQSLEKRQTYAYDVASNLTQTRVNRKYTYTWFDDTRNRYVTSSSITGDLVVPYEYDALNRLRAIRGNNGQNTTFGYDESGVATAISQPMGSIGIGLDGLNRAQSTTNAFGTTYTGFDSGGFLSSITDRRGLVSTFGRDGLGQLWQTQSPDTGVTSYSYNTYGRLGGMYFADGRYVSYTSDAAGRPSMLAAGWDLISFAYDSCTNGKGKLCSMTDSSGSSAFTYHPLGGVAQQTSTINGTAYSVAYSRDAMGRVTGIVYPDGKSVTYTYNQGQLATVSATPNGAQAAVITAIYYQPFGPFSSMSFGNGLTSTRNFDQDGRLTSQNVSAGSSVAQNLSFSWNSSNQITSIVNTRVPTQTQSFEYNSAGALTKITKGAQVESFAYDNAGNRTGHTYGGVTTTLAYAPARNRLEWTDRPGMSRVFTYRADGSSSGFTGADGVAVGIVYDDFGRLAATSRNSQTTAYQFNGLGQRVRKSGPLGATRFINDASGQLLAEFTEGGGWTDYIWANGELVGLIRNNTLYYIHVDQLGRPEVVTNAAKALVWSSNNDPFSRAVVTDAIGGLNVGLPGQYFDAETSTWHNGAREYDSTTGRYLQSDPIGLAGGLNTYAYAGGNPVSQIDPSGLDTLVIVGGRTDGNPFGHVAIAFTGRGVYSYGTSTRRGSSTTAYIASQQSRRSSVLYVLKTTPKQEAAMLKQLKTYTGDNMPNPKEDPLGALNDTCAVRTGATLEKGGITPPSSPTNPYSPFSPVAPSNSSPFPRDIGAIAAANASGVTSAAQGAAVPSGFESFNP